jgi:hypothetical protein
MTTNHDLFQRALARIPGGVNSPVRAFKSVGGEPFFTQRADGAYLWDVEGKRYIDYVGSWGRWSSATTIRTCARRSRKPSRTACRSARRARRK